MEWTLEQQKVIELRNRNLLVSAAAGSGKTAVLVERIISMISEGEHPIDIDHLLIVTFTNAAASEMRERIGTAIEKKLSEMPDNLHLQKQMTLIHSAQITTVHSFCLNVIRNHFNTIDLDPSFRIADDTELILMKSDVIAELLEKYYEEGGEDFLNFIECFSTGKSDAAIEELVLKLYQFSMSYPWPFDWLEERKDIFLISTIDEMNQSVWMKTLLNNIVLSVNDLIKKNDSAIAICKESDGPAAYLAALISDSQILHELLLLRDYESFQKALAEFNFMRLSGKKEEGVSEDKKTKVKLLREEIKKAVTDVKKNFFFQTQEEMLKDIQAMRLPMEVLINLTKDFAEVFADKKAEKNLVDFNDLEHFALQILVRKTEEGGENVLIPTPAADELSEYYAEILIDEYQDSNFVQETILNSISSERFGHPNLFMVGDVKQSIYKFRLARPEIFMEKYNTYDTTDSDHQRIDLHKNFRSRNIVLDSINFIFEQIMTKQLGNIEYDENAALYPGADFGEHIEGISCNTEILLVSVDTPDSEQNKEETVNIDNGSDGQNQEETEYNAKELEAKAIAKRIKELTSTENGLMIFDKKKQYRRAEYGDIVILLRTMSGWSEVFADTLMAEGIAAHTETQSGYFSTIEIRTILNLLKIIDNPRQDIPFASVLRSPIVNLTSNELAMIRIPGKKGSMYEAAADYVNGNVTLPGNMQDNIELSAKLKKFLNKLNEYRSMVFYLSIHELILQVLDDTGYYNYVSAMPAGDKRRANVDMLVQRAVQFEATSYRGLFHFIRYIEKLNKYDVDFGEAELTSENENAVKIMSIHKSKGLEFPIVFVSGMGKEFNNQDSKSKLLIHPDLGLGPDYFDCNLRIKAPTLIKKVIQKELVTDNLGEELRILYVALTRAKEKLIITGGVKKLDDKLSKWANTCEQKEKQLLYFQLSNASTCLDWIIPATVRYRGCKDILLGCGILQDETSPLYHADTEIMIRRFDYKELAETEVSEQLHKKINQELLLHWNLDTIYDEKAGNDIKSKIEYMYPYQTETKIHTKLTVSELKKIGQMEAEDLGVYLTESGKKESGEIVPNFIKQNEVLKGADLGTLYHLVLEHIKLTEIINRDSLLKELQRIVSTGIISQDELERIDTAKLLTFTEGKVAERMRNAAREGKLYTERQFIIGMKANDINKTLKSQEIVLVQGVIDVYFEEKDQIVVLDYKTDYVKESDGEEILKNRYAVQLDYYQKALEQLTGKQVKEKLIYSFCLNKDIKLP
jgi:ATP-dependent helicase/nuclease subunit A